MWLQFPKAEHSCRRSQEHFLRDVMDLTKHGEQATVSAVVTVERFGLPNDNSLSDLCTQYNALSNLRIKSSELLRNYNIRESLLSAINAIVKHIQNKGKIIVAGNGGSASQSQHLCSELMGRLKNKRSPIQAISLCADISLITCIANDFGYERIFSRQVEGLGNANDVFIAFTTSGKSRNIIEALLECKTQNICSIVFTGSETDTLKRLADHIVSVPLADTAIIQEVHMQLVHIMCEIIEDFFSDKNSPWDEVITLGQKGFKYLILDRDGVINHVKANGYIQSSSEFIFCKDFLEHIKQLSEIYQHIFIVSNQKGVGKGLMTKEELESVHQKMITDISNQGGRIDNIYVSTNADSNAIENKPNTGLADKIIKDYPYVDFNSTVVVGDSASDYLFANNLKCRFVYARTR